MTRDQINPRGPVFVSHRQRDGKRKAAELAWLLRAAGVPVWHDQSDLPPGDTNERLTQALASGLSGGVLLITPNIAESVVVRTVEAPKLLDLEKDPAFVFAVANTVRRSDGSMDLDAPDDLLGKPRGTLRRLKQHRANTRRGLVNIAREIVLHRVATLALPPGTDGADRLHVSVQTRAVPHANDSDNADLSIRLRPPTAGRLPSLNGLKDLKEALPLLPEAVSMRRPRTVHVTGGGHLTVAFALGTALPATLIGSITVEAQDETVWRTGTVSTPPGDEPLTRIEGHGAKPVAPTGTPRTVLTYVDLLPERSDAAYTRLLTEHPDFDAWMHLRPATEGPLDPAAANPLISEVASRLRKLSQDHDNADLHLALRAPFPVAVLLGRLLNTLRVTAYEWDRAPDGDPDARPRFVPALILAATDANGPISAVLLPKP